MVTPPEQDLDVLSTHTPFNSAGVRTVVSSWRRNWPTRVAGLAGMALVFVCYIRFPLYRQAKPSVYLMTVFWYCVVLALYDTSSSWSEQAGHSKIKLVGCLIIAVMLTLWSALCVVGVVNYPVK